MRAPWLLVFAIGCGAPPAVVVEPPQAAATPLPSVDAPPPHVPLEEVGKDSQVSDWIELAMPEDARVLSFSQDVSEGHETWTLLESGPRRVLRIKLETANGVALAAFAGEATKDGLSLHLVEVRGNARFAPERLTATCARDSVCEDAKPSHRVAADSCTFVAEGDTQPMQTWFAPGRGVDFVIGSCPRPAMRERSYYPRARSRYPRDVP
jgi:hypothetical protein